MLDNLKNKIKNTFSFLYTENESINKQDVLAAVSNVKNERPEVVVRTREEVLASIDLSVYDDEVYINEYKEGRPNLVILDDLPGTEILYTIDFKNIEMDYGFDIMKEFNVIMIYGRKAGFAALKFIEKGIKIDYAILDITIDSLEKFDNGDFLDLDGIDIAITLDKLDKNIKILFSSAHTLNIGNALMYDYIKKYEAYFKRSINNHAIDKNSIRYKTLHNFLRH